MGAVYRTGVQRRTRAGVFSLTAALLATLLPVVAPTPAQAIVRAPFDAVYSTEDNGAITLIGASNMDCPTLSSGCTSARAGTATGTSNNNNVYNMAFVDVDLDLSTSNSSTATLAMPAGSTVLNARLIWGGRTVAGVNGVAPTKAVNTIKFRAPAATSYTTLTATNLIQPSALVTSDGGPFQASVDVTDIVKAGGNGLYMGADIGAATGQDRYAGWSLIVSYRNPSLPLRNLRVFEGFADITSATGNNSVDIPVTGFLTPTTGNVNASVGVVAWEGDYGTTGDALRLAGTTLSDATRPAANFFDSRISDAGVDQIGRNPANLNNFGIDIGRIATTNVLSNGSTSATINLTSSGDSYYPGVVTSQIDLFTPSFNAVSKTVTNLNGNNPAQPGDTLEYRLTFANTGGDFADTAVVRDPLPTGLTFVPGSLVVETDPGGATGTKTDATGDDTADYTAGDRTVRYRVGTGANATTGGTIAPGGSVATRFRATVTRAAAGSTIVNTPILDYKARTLNRNYSFSGNAVNTTVTALADLAAAKTVASPTQNAGQTVTYTISAINNGPNPGTGVTLTDTLPTGTTYVSTAPPAGVTCSPSGQTVTCSLGTVANGATVAIPVVARVNADTAGGVVINSVRVAGTTADDVSVNNTATVPVTVTQSADLQVTSSLNGPVVPGTEQTVLTTTVTNAGPSTARDVVISIPLPDGTTVVWATDGCTVSAGTLTCVVGTLAPGASFTADVVLAVDPGFAAPTLSITSSASASTPDPANGNNSSTATQPTAPLADLRVTKTASTPNPVAGTRTNYTITVTNDGPSDARNVVVNDPIQTGVSVVSASPQSGTCTTGSTVTCQIGVVPAGGSVTVSLRVAIAPDRPAGELTNAATATTSTPQEFTANDSASVATVVGRVSDLTITKTAVPQPVVAGGPLTYNLAVSNHGPSVADNVVVTDTLPLGLTATGDQATQGACTIVLRTITCQVGTLAVDGTAAITITADTPGIVPPAGFTNTATVTSTSTDPNPADNTATHVSTVTAQADLAVTQVVAAPSVVAGTGTRYTMTVTNEGPSVAQAVTSSQALPAGFTIGTITPTTGTCQIQAGRVVCNFGNLAAAAAASVTVDVSVPSGQALGSTGATATVASTTPDPTQSNNTTTTLVSVRAEADVRIANVQAPGTFVAGEAFTRTFSVGNVGPSDARDVAVVADLPAGVLDLVVVLDGVSCPVTGGRVNCAVGTVTAGRVLNGTVSGRIAASSPPGPRSFSATISTSSPDPVPLNNSVTAATAVTAFSRLTIDQSVNPSPLVAGARATYGIVAANTGPSDATTVTVTYTVPTELTVVSAVSTLGTCAVAGQIVTCVLDRLPSGTSDALSVTVDVSPTATGSVETRAQVVTVSPSPGGEDQLDILTTPVVQSADLVLTGTMSQNPVRAGTAQTYTLTVSNTGPSVATAVVLSDTLPTGMVLLPGGVAVQGGTCTPTPDNTGVNCSFGTIPPGSSRVVVLNALVPADTPAGTVLTDTAAVGSPTPDPTPANRTISLAATVSADADLAITTNATSGNAEAGRDTSYTITVANNGPSVARSVVISDPLPTGLSFISADPSCTLVGTEVRCAIGDLAQGAIKTVALTVRLAADYASPTVVNTATVSAATSDSITINNSSSAIQSVSANADLRSAISLTSGPLVAGTPATYRVSTTNLGPSVAPQVVLTDPLPAGTTFVSATAAGGGSCVFDTGAVRCTWPSLAVGASVSADITVNLSSGAPAGSTVSNTVTAAAAVADSHPSDNAATATATVGAVADVSVVQVLTSGAPVAGGKLTWQAVVRNDGPSSAYGVTTTDPAPAGVTYSAVASTLGTCSINGSGAAVCAIGVLASGATATVTVTGTLAPDYTGTGVTNTVTVSSTSSDPDPSDNTSSAVSDTTSSADVALSVVAQPEPVVPGSQVNWTFTVTNSGPSTSRGVVVNDELPAGVTPRPQAGCALTGQRFSCPIGDVPVGGSASVTVSGTLAAGFSEASLRNTGTISGGTADPDTRDNTATAVSTPNPQADVAVVVVQPANTVAGQPATWTVRVSDAGPSDAVGTTVTVAIPAYLNNASVRWPSGVCTVAGAIATCPIGIVTAGQTIDVTLTGTIDAAYSGPLTVGAEAIAQTPDPSLSNNVADAVSSASRAADLVTTLTAPTGAVPGTRLTWVLSSRNLGPSTADGVTLTATLPQGVSAITATTQAGTCTVTGRDISCPVGAIAPGVTVLVTLSGLLASNVTAPTITASGSSASSTPDPDSANNSTSTSSPVTPQANLHVAKAVTSGIPVQGAPIVFAIEVSNGGPSDAQSVTLADTVPATVGQLTVQTPVGTCTLTGQDLACALGTVAAGAPPITVTVRGVLADGAGDTVSNTASVSSPTPEVDGSDNSGSVTASATESADLSIGVAVPGTVVAGRPLTYTVTVTNDGPSTADAVALDGVLPAGLLGLTSDRPSCQNLTACSLGDIAPGASVVVRFTGTVDPNYAGSTLESRITVSSPIPDSDGRDNSAASTVAVTTSADLATGLSVDPNPVAPGTTLLYTATISSQGPSSTQGVVTFSPLPDGTDIGGPITSTQGTCSMIGRSVVCDLGRIDPTTAVIVRIPVLVASSFADGNIVKSISVQGSTNDPDQSNNSASAEAAVVRVADLSVDLTAPAEVVPGDTATWDLKVVNSGPSDAPVTVVHTLPAGVGEITAIASGGTCTVVDQTVRCDLGTVGAGNTATVTVYGMLVPDITAAQLTSGVVLESVVAEPTNAQPDGRSDSASSTVRPRADIFVEVVSDTPTVTPGQQATWTVTAINAGPSTARDIVVTAVAPAGTTGATLTGPPGVTCDSAALRCVIPALTPGKEGSAQLTLRATVPADFSAPLVDAEATVASPVEDPNPGDNTATASTPVSPTADLRIVVAVTPTPIVAGGPVALTATITNAGPSVAAGTTFTLPVPVGLENVTVEAPPGVTCDTTVACAVGTLPVGDIQIVIRGQVSPTYTENTLTVSASVSSDAGDPNPGDNTTTTVSQSEVSADLGVTATIDPAAPVAGSPVTVTATVRANGPSTATDVTFTLPIPAELRDVQVTAPPGVTCDPTVACAAGTMLPGTEITVIVRGVLAPDFTGGTLALTASVDASSPDNNPTNDSATATSSTSSSADLSVVTAVAPSPLTAGSPVTLTSTIRNGGPSTATGVVFTLPVPAGLEDITVEAPAGVTCDNSVRCTAASVAPGQDLVVTVRGRVKADVTAPDITVTSTVNSPVSDPSPADNSSTATTGVGVAGDVRVALVVDPQPLVAGSPVTVTATVRNEGPSTATGTTFTLPVPSGLVAVEVTAPAGVTCDESVACTVGTLAPGTESVITVRARVAPGFTGQDITLTGSAATTSADPTPANNTATTTTPVGANAGVSVALAVDPATVTPGTPVTATARVSNAGPSTAAGVTLAIPVPAGLTNVVVNAPVGVTCDTSVACTIGSIEPGADVVITVTGVLDPAYPGNAITLTATSGSTTPDPTPGDGAASVTRPVAASADLDALLDITQANPVAGSPIEIVADVVNRGPSTAVGATLAIPVPAGVITVSVTAPAGVNCDSGVFCTLGTLAPNASVRVVLRGTVAQDVTAPITATATATAQTPDPTPGNNSSTDTGTTATSADLAFTAEVNPDPITAGTAVAVTTTLTNNGPSAATGVSFTVPVPAGLTGVTVDAPAGVTCDTAVACTVGTVPAGGTVTVVVRGTVAPTVTSPLTFTGSATSAVTDPNTADNAFSVTGTVGTAADLGVTLAYEPGAVVAGSPVAAKVTVRNAGPSTAAGTTLSLPLPAGIVDVEVLAPAGVSCTTGVSCTYGDLAPGASVEITVRGRIAPDFSAPDLTLTATTATAANDPSAANNTATATTAVASSANLSVVSTLDPTALVAGSPFTSVTTISNSGPSTATGATFTLPIPAGVTGVEVLAPAGVSCDTSVKCTIGSVAPGTDVRVEVRGTVDPAFTGPSLAFTPSATATTADPNPADNSTTVTGTVGVTADLRVTVTPNPLSLVSGEAFTTTVSARNDGPSVATGVTLTLPIPAGVVDVEVVAPAGVTCDTTVACTVGSLAPNTQVDVLVRARVAQDFAGTGLVFTGSVASPTADQDTADNSTTVPVQVNASADLSASTTVDPAGGLTAGSPVTITTTIRNAGPSAAVGTTYTFPVPAGLIDVLVTAPAGVTCDTSVTCTVGSVDAGEQLVITVTGRVAPDFTGGSLTFDTAVSSPTPDPDPTGNSSSTTRPVAVNADLSAQLSVDPGTLTAGSAFTATATLRNVGPSTATGVTFAVPLPAGVGNVEVVAPAGVTCTTAVVCTAATVAPGATTVITIRGTVDPAFTGSTLPFSATASSPTPDASPGNNTAGYDAATGASAGLSVQTVVDPVGLTAGSPFSATTTIRNAGPSVAAGVTFTLPIPAGVVDVEVVAPAGVTCDTTVACTVGPLAAGSDVVVVVRGRVDAGFTGGSVSLTAGATSSTPDSNQADNSTTVVSPVAVTADLGVVVTADQSSLTAGSPVAITTTVSNAGPSTATGVAVTISVPAGLTNVVVNAPVGVTCDTAVSCTISSLAAGANTVITVRGTVSPTFTGSDLPFTGAVSSGAGDPAPSGNTSTITLPVTVAADLALVSLTGPATAVAGTPIAVTATLRNAGPSTAAGATFTLPIPAGLTGVQVTGPAGVTCDSTAVCTLGDLAPGAEITIAVTGTIAPTYTGPGLTFTGTLDSPSADPTPGNDSATATTAVTVAANLAVTSALDSTSVTAGTTVKHTVTIRNNGPSTSGPVTVDLPDLAGVTVTDVQYTAPGGVSCVARSVSCTIDPLAPGASAQIVVVAAVAADFTGSSLTFTAAASSPSPDPSTADNSASATATVTASANVGVTAALDPTALVAGSPVRVTATISNTGPSTASGVTFTLPIPAGVQNVTVTAPTGVTCDNTVSCTAASLAPGATIDLVINGVVAPNASTNALTFTATAGSATPDPDGSGTVTLNAGVTSSADLSINTTFAPGTLTAGENFTATTVIANGGPSTATGVSFTLPIPPGVDGVTVTAPPGVTCDNSVSCTIGDVAPGTTLTVVVTGRVTPTTTTPPTFTATVSSPTPGPDPADRTVTITPPLVVSADLRTTVVLDPATPTAGSPLSATVTVANSGPSAATGVVVVIPVPAGLTGADFVVPPGVTCDAAGTCVIASVAPGAQVSIVLRGTVDPAATGDLTVSASATSPATDSTPTDNSFTATAPVTANADLVATAVVTSGPPVAGSPVTITATVTNGGPSTATGVTFTIPLPPGLQQVQVTAPAGVTCDTTVLCTVGTLAPGAAVTVVVQSVLAADATGPIEITATADSATADADETDNTITVSNAVTAVADLTVTADIGPDRVVAGSAATITATVANAGPSVATGVTITIPVPAGLLDVVVTAPPGVTCDTTVTCTVASLAPGASVEVLVTGTVAPEQTTPLTSTVTVDSAASDPNGAGNTVALSEPVAADADLSMVLDFTADTLTAGAPAVVVAKARNAGPSTAVAVRLALGLPGEFENIVILAPNGVTCDTTIACELGPLAPGAEVVIEVRGVFSSDVAGDATVVGIVESTTNDPVPGNESVIVTQAVSTETDVSITKGGPTQITAGQNITWTLAVHADGPSDARNVVVVDTLPKGVTPVSADPACVLTDRTYRCALGTLAQGGDRALTITAQVDPEFSDQQLDNAASVTTTVSDTDVSNNTSLAVTQVAQIADLSIDKSLSPDPVTPGQQATYTIEVINFGYSTATNVVITDPIGPGLTPVSATATAGTCAITGQVVTCTPGSIGPDGDVTVTIVVDVDPGFVPNTISNTATVVSDVTEADPSDNTVSIAGSAAAITDLGLAMTPDRPLYAPGDPINWLLTITNNGSSTAREVVLTDQLPANVEGVVVPAGCVLTTNRLVCDLGDLAPGDSATVLITGQVRANATSGSIVNTASVVSSTAEQSPTDNFASSTSTVDAQVDLQVSKTVDGPIVAGDDATWVVVVTNAGTSAAADVVITDALPTGATYVSATGATCTATDSVVSCGIGTLAAGATATVRLTAAIDPAVAGDTLVNSVLATSSSADANTADDDAVSSEPVQRRTALSVVKTADKTTAAVGDEINWIVVLSNAGPSTAPAVTVTDELPAGVTLISAVTSTGTYDPASGVWRLDAITPGEQPTLRVAARIDRVGSLVNIATLTAADVIDSADTDDTATASTEVSAADTDDDPGTPVPDTDTDTSGQQPDPTDPEDQDLSYTGFALLRWLTVGLLLTVAGVGMVYHSLRRGKRS
ncbi:CARDB domain-containing protein [Actinokineospora cianjurensis]|uniref:Putative repeat protein (TIGR01451 family) n=1 Tax=Actinokineospora cianjurensis TaxID=585224 RepID=A0A421BDA1_9PSEU|nr:CARDB domain-containing protein [Actinokineospora cianjurensis]RLK62375.1 putative repeat protein (TIGR01451 family) [Actinokineospora cianjurensis]